MTTTDLSDFGHRERVDLIKILIAWNQHGLPEQFQTDEVIPMMNRDSRNVFLTNSDYQTAMMNNNKLEMWNVCGNCGHEGFEDDCSLHDEGCNECMEYEEHEIEYVNKT